MRSAIKRMLFGEVGFTNQRDRETWLQRSLASLPAGARILDAGAGELRYKRFCSHLKYVSQDFGQYEGTGNCEGKQTGSWDNSKLDIVSDIIAIPEPEASFDAIMCVEVFEHIPRPDLAIREFARLLKPGGTLILTAPFASLNHFAPYFFASGYSKYWYEKFLPENGFLIDEIVLNGNYFEYLAQEVRRLSSIERDFATSRFGSGLRGAIVRVSMLALLHRMSRKNRRSEEVLCYGLQVRARKKR